MATTDKYTRIEQTEFLCLPQPKRPQGIPLAEIRLGAHEGKWASAIGYQQHGGDFSGMGEPLGFWNGRSTLYATRAEALANAVSRLLKCCEGRPLMAEHAAWARSLLPQSGDQLDLFGAAA